MPDPHPPHQNPSGHDAEASTAQHAAEDSSTDLPSTQHVGSAAIAAIELRPKDAGYVVTGIGGDGTVVSSGPFVEDVPLGIAVARGIVRLTEFQRDGDLFRAEAI